MASGAAGGETGPLINDNPELQSYYQSLESRIGYRLVLGGTRHFGYWYVRLLCSEAFIRRHITQEVMGWQAASFWRRAKVASWHRQLRDDQWLLSSSDDVYSMISAMRSSFGDEVQRSVTYLRLW